MVNFFVQKGKQGILEALIITSCGNYDGSKLMSILSSSGLYYLQCYLFSTGLLSEECDFYSPLLRMYSALCQATEKKDLEKTQRIGMTCLWYLHKCFGFTAIPSGVMDRERKVKVVL